MKSRHHARYSAEEREMILNKTMSDKEIAAALGRTPDTIRSIRHNLRGQLTKNGTLTPTEKKPFDKKEYMRQYTKEHEQEYKEYQKAYRQANKENAAKYKARYRQKHPDRIKGEHEATNSGLAYSATEDAAILAREIPDKELSKQLGRTIEAIQLRRNRLKTTEQMTRKE